MKKQLVCIAAVVMMMGCAHNHHNKGPIQLDEIPAPARDAINQAANGGTVTEIKRHHHHGHEIYEAYITNNGKYWAVEVNSEGTVLKKKQEKHEHRSEKDSADSD